MHLRTRGFPSTLATRLFHFPSVLWAPGATSGSQEIGEVILGWAKHLSVQLPPRGLVPRPSEHTGCPTHEADINSPSEMTTRSHGSGSQMLAAGSLTAGELADLQPAFLS